FPHGLFLEFDPTSRALLLIPRDRTARLMSRDGELRTTFAEPLGSWRDSSVAWSADGQRFYSIDGKDIIERDTSRGEELRRFHSDSKLACLSISPQGDRLGTGNWELEVEIWDLGNGKVETFFESPTWEHGWWLGDDDDGFCDVRWSPNGKWIGCSTSEAAYVFVFNARSGELHWNGGFLGGRTGSPPVELHFAPSEDRRWYGYRIGIGSDVSLSQPMAQPEGILVGRGFATSARALGARSEGDGFTALDLDTGKSHWQRLDFGNGGHVVLVAAGWIDGEALDHRLVATRWLDGRTTEYYPILERFDPKRVRAGLAGIPLLEIAARE
ncbi:MAG: WD40 repeat domain-containing protein, partial [Planctomycetota bacterium]